MDSEIVATTTHDCGITRKQLGSVARELANRHGPIEIHEQGFEEADGMPFMVIHWRKSLVSE